MHSSSKTQITETLSLQGEEDKPAAETDVLAAKVLKYEEEILKLTSTKKKLFAILSHDLRSPFNGLLGFTNFLADEIDSLSTDEIKVFANNISASAKNLLDLVDEVFNWAKAETGETDFIPMKVEINYIVEEVFFLLRNNAVAKEIKLINKVAEDSYAFADMNMIKTIISNLVSNAVKFSNPGGVVTVKYTGVKNNYCNISVEDKGIGITGEAINKLFKIESHFSTRGTANEKGTGLGLIICKTLLEKNKGTIKVKSIPGEGTVFTINLPVTEPV